MTNLAKFHDIVLTPKYLNNLEVMRLREKLAKGKGFQASSLLWSLVFYLGALPLTCKLVQGVVQQQT